MAYSVTSTGLVYATDFPGSALPTGLTSVISDPGGTLTIGSSTLTVAPSGAYTYATTTNAIPSSVLVIRAKAKNGAGDGYVGLIDVRDVASRPSAALAQNYMYGWPSWLMHPGNSYAWGMYNNAFKANGTHPTTNTNYIYEITWNADLTSATTVRRDATTLESLLTSGAFDVAYSNSRYLVIGDGSGQAGSIILSNLSMMTSLNVTVTDIGTDTVKLYDASDNLKVTGTTAGGTATLDCTLVDFGGTGFSGYFLRGTTRLPSSGNITIWGGDTWPGAEPTPTVTAITPARSATSVSVTITGTEFSGSTVKLTKTGETDISATGVSVTETSITCTFNVTNKKPGNWNVVVTNADSQAATLSDGFTVLESGRRKNKARIIGAL